MDVDCGGRQQKRFVGRLSLAECKRSSRTTNCKSHTHQRCLVVVRPTQRNHVPEDHVDVVHPYHRSSIGVQQCPRPPCSVLHGRPSSRRSHHQRLGQIQNVCLGSSVLEFCWGGRGVVAVTLVSRTRWVVGTRLSVTPQKHQMCFCCATVALPSVFN